MNVLARRALLRLITLAPVDLPAPGTVEAADLRTSMCDARAAVVLALGKTPDVDGYPTATCPSCGVICGHRTTCGIAPASRAALVPAQLELFDSAAAS